MQAQLERVRPELGRCPVIDRHADTAMFVARTGSIDAITRDDITLGHRVDMAFPGDQRLTHAWLGATQVTVQRNVCRRP